MKEIIAFLTNALGGLWGYVAAAGFAAALSFGATHEIDSLAYGKIIAARDLTIANMKTVNAENVASNVAASLAQLQGFISTMNMADANYNAALTAIDKQFAIVESEFKNATQKPLPVDCKPDAGRLRILTDAVAATNSAQASGPAK